MAGEIAAKFHVSITRVCKLMGIHKSYFYYEWVKDDSEVEAAIRQKAEVSATHYGEAYTESFDPKVFFKSNK